MWYQVTIVADTNDADYVTSVFKCDEETLDYIIKPMAKAIKNFQPYKSKSEKGDYEWTHRNNYPCGEYFPRTDLGEKFPAEIYPEVPAEVREAFEDFLPYGERGIHSIESIAYCPWSEKIELLHD